MTMLDGMMELTAEVVDRLEVDFEHDEHLMMLDALVSVLEVKV